jgi:hypothetical protein
VLRKPKVDLGFFILGKFRGGQHANAPGTLLAASTTKSDLFQRFFLLQLAASGASIQTVPAMFLMAIAVRLSRLQHFREWELNLD